MFTLKVSGCSSTQILTKRLKIQTKVVVMHCGYNMHRPVLYHDDVKITAHVQVLDKTATVFSSTVHSCHKEEKKLFEHTQKKKLGYTV